MPSCSVHFKALFQWSNLGLIFAIDRAPQGFGLSCAGAAAGIVVLSGVINLFIGSVGEVGTSRARACADADAARPHSETATAVYRVGDLATNIMLPLFVCLPLVLTFCERWNNEFGLGSVLATMIFYPFCLLIGGVVLTVVVGRFWLAPRTRSGQRLSSALRKHS